MSHRAGPPILYHVRGASGTLSLTTSSRPAKGLEVAILIVAAEDIILPLLRKVAADFPDVSRAHRDQQVTAPQVIFQIAVNLLECRNVYRSLAIAFDPRHQIRCAHQFSLGIAVAHEINIG